jgi:mutator protein MutT
VVATSIFTQWAEKYPVPFGLAAVLAAGLSAVQGTSKLAERVEAHRIAGAEYGRLRRQADMLRLRLEADDITREGGFAELNRIGEELSDLAKKSRALSDSIYYSAVKRFDTDHQEYFENGPSHAGGVVIRREDTTVKYLVVNAKTKLDEWVLPKGHIEPGESAEQAARREVREETGVEAAILESLDSVEFSAPRGRVKAQFYLMEAVKASQPREGRNVKWCTYDEAVRYLSFKEAQRLICQAHLLLLESTSSNKQG